MNIVDWFKIIGVVVSVGGVAITVIWSYARFVGNSAKTSTDVERLENDLKSLDGKTSEAVAQLARLREEDRARSEKREDRIHEKIDTIARELGALHRDVLRALIDKGG